MPWPDDEWYDKMDLSAYKPKIEKYNITEKEVLDKIKICEMINEENGMVMKPVKDIKQLPKLYARLLKIANELTNKELKNWYVEQLKLPILRPIRIYEMDHIMLLEYLVKNKKKPRENSMRDEEMMQMAYNYYIVKKLGGGGNFLSKLARALLMGI